MTYSPLRMQIYMPVAVRGSNNVQIYMPVTPRGLKYMIVYIAQNILTFVMYCMYGESLSSLLIDSTDSMILYAVFSLNGFGMLGH